MERLTNGFDYCQSQCDFGKDRCFFQDQSKCYENNMYNKLREYEIAEEQGLLLRLPCKVGDTVYCIHKNEIIEDTVFDYDIWSLKNGISLRISLENYRDYIVGIFGKTVFLTYQEAELELANIQQSHAEAIMDERNGR